MRDRQIQGTVKVLRRPRKILLGQLNSNGDCIYATTVARQIKQDYPGCHLTWAIGSMCSSIIDGNPDVDDVWVIPLNNIDDFRKVWERFEQEALEKKKLGVFDEVFFTQIYPANLHLYDGTIRSSIFRGYPFTISLPVSPIIRLSPLEIENVHRFADVHSLQEKQHVILFETSPRSGQSFLTLDFAKEVASKVVSTIPNSCVILSSSESFDFSDELIIDGSELSLRQHVELTKYCTLLVGGSSGISWSCTSDWAKPLPMIQLLKADAMWFNSFVNDHEQWGLSTDKIIEMEECSIDDVYQCIAIALIDGFDEAKSRYHKQMRMKLRYYQYIFTTLLIAGEYKKLFSFYCLNMKKHGMLPQFFWKPLRGILSKITHLLLSLFPRSQ